ncbi:hypothetical protein C0Q70_19186 [Pomacea canaliculata]|uniref:Uncharacterized protein n=1 Tax=Pomacea canaliculata TaxID=400727 RepID=A0A2T7NIL8_POMCA|nr:hypothetical protein C0Q70_19186 [Pomacea canaliculata]
MIVFAFIIIVGTCICKSLLRLLLSPVSVTASFRCGGVEEGRWVEVPEGGVWNGGAEMTGGERSRLLKATQHLASGGAS